jgi:hypothetical protein
VAADERLETEEVCFALAGLIRYRWSQLHAQPRAARRRHHRPCMTLGIVGEEAVGFREWL